MSKVTDKKNNTKGMIAALRTVLERYPALLETNDDVTETSFSFSLNLLKLFGIDENEVLDWLGEILADGSNGKPGLLSTLEQTIKTTILLTFKDLYTCSVNPTLPDDVMMSFYDEWAVRGEGIKIPIGEIDAFGLLNYTPTDKRTSIFYTDTDPWLGYTPQNVYSSMDFNAYLWYVINKGNFWATSQKKKCVWDNRVRFYYKFQKSGCLNGWSLSDTSSPKGAFFNTSTLNSPVFMVDGVGTKKEILACEYREEVSPTGGDPRTLRVYLNAGRYYRTSISGMSNKTIFEFNADFIYSLKLFEPKVMIAQIINAVLGIASNLSVNLSVEQIMLDKKIERIVEKIVTASDNEEEISTNCFYTFSNEEYNAMLEEAEAQYNGTYQSGNETREEIDVDAEAIADEIYKIGQAEDLQERKTAITDTLKNTADIIARDPETPDKDKFNFKSDIVSKFIKETITQICKQVLSPKVMILFAINEKIMNPNAQEEKVDVEAFLKKFDNLIVTMVRKIANAIMQKLFDFLIQAIKPLITLFVQKLLLESIYDYKQLISALIQNCSLPRFTGNALETDTITHADIIPEATTPPEEGCRE